MLARSSVIPRGPIVGPRSGPRAACRHPASAFVFFQKRGPQTAPAWGKRELLRSVFCTGLGAERVKYCRAGTAAQASTCNGLGVENQTYEHCLTKALLTNKRFEHGSPLDDQIIAKNQLSPTKNSREASHVTDSVACISSTKLLLQPRLAGCFVGHDFCPHTRSKRGFSPQCAFADDWAASIPREAQS